MEQCQPVWPTTSVGHPQQHLHVTQYISDYLGFKIMVEVTIYEINPVFNPTLQKTTFMVVGKIDSVKEEYEFNSDNADKLYASDEKTVIGYQKLMTILTRLDDKPIFVELKFNQTLNGGQIAGLYSQVTSNIGRLTPSISTLLTTPLLSGTLSSESPL